MSFTTELLAFKNAITAFAGRITTKLEGYVLKTQINGVSGVCPLDAGKLVPIANMPGIYKNYDLHNFVNGKPLTNEVLMRAVAVRSFLIPINCAGSYAFATTGAAVAFVISILKNGVEVGTINYAVGATAATFTMATALTINPGDQFALRCKTGVQDATLSDLTIGIYANAV